MLDAADVSPLVAGVDYTLDELGRWVFTAQHLKSRGYCCFNACRNCPWGQAGRTRQEAFADLQWKLNAVESTLQEAGWDIEVTGYSMGVLQVRSPQTLCTADLPELGRRIRQYAAGTLPLVGMAWI